MIQRMEIRENKRFSPTHIEDNLEAMHYILNQQTRVINIVANFIKNAKKTLASKTQNKLKIRQLQKELDRIEQDIFHKGRGSWNVILGKTNFTMQCAHCQSGNNIELHHIDNNQSNNKIENLIPLCKNCHKAVHNNEFDVTMRMWQNSRL